MILLRAESTSRLLGIHMLLSSVPNARVMYAMSQEAVRVMRDRAFPLMGMGRDITNSPFGPYSSSYLRYKLRHGTPPISPLKNLRFTHQTAKDLRVLNVNSSGTRGVVGFALRRRIAQTLEQRYQFFGLMPQERALVVQAGRRVLQQQLTQQTGQR